MTSTGESKEQAHGNAQVPGFPTDLPESLRNGASVNPQMEFSYSFSCEELLCMCLCVGNLTTQPCPLK